MRISAAAVAVLVLISLASASAWAQAPAADTDTSKGVRDATMRYYVALNSVMRSDVAPMEAVWSHSGDVSNLSPDGARAEGWNEVRTYYQDISRQNEGAANAGRITPKDIDVVVSGTMGYSVCVETGQVRIPQGPLANYSQRVTNVFRFEDGKWKMVHHHADANTGASSPAR